MEEGKGEGKWGVDLWRIDFGEALDEEEDSFDDLVFGEMIVTVRWKELEGSTVRTPSLRFPSS